MFLRDKVRGWSTSVSLEAIIWMILASLFSMVLLVDIEVFGLVGYGKYCYCFSFEFILKQENFLKNFNT